MNHILKSSLVRSQSNPVRLEVSLFHSTSALDRRRRDNWNQWNHSWISDDNENDPSSSKGTSWFKKPYWEKEQRRFSKFQESQQRSNRSKRRIFQFITSDDEEVETIFQSAFGGTRYYYWSPKSGENFQWRKSNRRSNQSWQWSYSTDDEDSTFREPDLASNRLALGLSASGPLTLEEVKNAYRACALKWHPDRHQGSSKVVAEEKFKHCSAAYQSICDNLAAD
ncbi:hypothetical protein QJS10_CPB15g00181 [Acorus calamus]|uniref:J domain-containing protein n=1 Tax=Acorus calamus TaxID=4465 RepID=A0AAV9D701_ACOCL|nr:hypothetical protein QJS10_CPB15g00181 [Acorus calamus]